MVIYSYKKHERLNNYLNQLNFLIVEFFLFPCFLLVSLVLLPFAYLKIFIVKLKNIRKKITKKNRSERIKSFFYFCFFGYLQLLGNTIADVINMASHLFIEESQLQRRSIPSERFTLD